MVISDALRYVYVAIPRTASTTISNLLVDKYEGRFYATHHNTRIPQTCSEHLRILSIRNPYERMLSWWWFACVSSPGPILRKYPRGTGFREFMLDLIEKKQLLLGGGKVLFSWPGKPSVEAGIADLDTPGIPQVTIYLPMTFWAERIKPDRILRVETLLRDVRALPFVGDRELELKGLKQSGRPATNFHDQFGPKERVLVHQYCGEDFAAFGYERKQ